MRFHLPPEIYRLIQLYLTHADNHYFLNTSKTLFSKLKKESIYFVLTISSSEEYIKNPIFQEILLNKVENGWKQISIRLKNSRLQPKPSRLLPVHKVIFETTYWENFDFNSFSHIECLESEIGYNETSIPPIPRVKELLLGRCPSLDDVKSLGHLSKLHLELGSLSTLTDFAPLKNIPHLTLLGNLQGDFSVFHQSKQKFLRIVRSTLLKDVTNFAGIRQLTLDSCSQLEDLSPLRGIYHLSLLSCTKVKDISGLGQHFHLAIENCSYKLTGYEALLNIPNVSLTRCDISDASVLKYATNVSLTKCGKIIDITPLSGVKSLKLNCCSEVNNLESLSQIPDLSLTYEKELPTLTNALRNQKLYLSLPKLYEEPNNYDFLKNIQELSIARCDNVIQLINDGFIEYFEHLQSLTISNSMVLKHVNGLGRIPTLRLKHCYVLRDISALGKNRIVELNNCHALQDIRALATVPIVEIRNCPVVSDFSCLAKVERLNLKVLNRW